MIIWNDKEPNFFLELVKLDFRIRGFKNESTRFQQT